LQAKYEAASPEENGSAKKEFWTQARKDAKEAKESREKVRGATALVTFICILFFAAF
jgi:hypothetical protein